MTRKLFWEAVSKFALGVLLVGLLVFLPAGTLDYPCGWLFMGVLFVPMFCAGIVMIAKAPDLLRKRLQAKEEQGQQKKVIASSGLMFLAGFVLCDLSWRWQFLILPRWVSVAAAAAFLLGYGLFAEVLRENAYLSRTVEVQENQKVIDTGLYGLVRHPMYTATLLMFLAMPLILGAGTAVCVFCVYPFLIAKRIENEEQVLEEGLPGYREYKQKVKYRMIPFVW